MFLELIAIVIVFAVFRLYRKWSQIKKYWAVRNVPYIPPHPVLGNLTFLHKKNPGIWMREIYNRNQPYVGLWWFWRPALVVNSPEIARRVLVKDSAIFKDRFSSSGKKDPIGGLNIFLVNDPLWTLVRKCFALIFTASKLRIYHKYVIAKTRDLVKRIKMEMDTNKRVNLREVYTDYTTDVVGFAAFGVASNATLTGESALRKVTKDFMKFTYWRGLSWATIFFYPELVDIFRFSFFPKSATEYFRKIFQHIVQQRGGYDAPVGEGRDFIDFLRKMKQDFEKDNEVLPEEVLIAQAAAIVQAGFDTNGTAITFCSYELAHNPRVQEKLFEELVQIKEKISKEDFDAEVLSEMKYLNAVLKETLRKYTSMGWIDRVVATSYRIDEHVTIAAGTPVYVNAIGMQYDPEYFPDPENFIPERFLAENEKSITPFTYIPFGEGPRHCVGRRFGIQTVICVIAHIVLNYKIVAKPGSHLPREVEIDKKGLFYSPGENLYVDFIPRDE